MRKQLLACILTFVFAAAPAKVSAENCQCLEWPTDIWQLQQLVYHWLGHDVPWDFTGDGIVNMSDFGVLGCSWRSCRGPAADAAREGFRQLDEILLGLEIRGATEPVERFACVVEQVSQVIPLGPENPVDLGEDLSFWVSLEALNVQRFELSVTGEADGQRASVFVSYTFGLRECSVFDYAIATKGPLQVSGNVHVDGQNISVESDVYIESVDSVDALSIIGNSQITGDVYIVNPDAEVTLVGGHAGIGGEYGEAAIANHVHRGVEPVEFPFPNASHFKQYATGDVIDPNTDTDQVTMLVNAVVAPETNPVLCNDVVVRGVLYVEAPNVVVFCGDLDIIGLIVCAGDVSDDSGTNQLIFLGPISSRPVGDLPDKARYDGVRVETGTFILAPGFKVSLGGSFDTLHGAVAGSGIEFFGNAGGTIAGSLINYANRPMVLSSNDDLIFNRVGMTHIPAGFEPAIILHRDDRSRWEKCWYIVP